MKKIAILMIAITGLLTGCVVYDPHRGPYHDGPGPSAYRGDRDRDGVPNRVDRDRDNDGVPNQYDRRPNNPARY